MDKFVRLVTKACPLLLANVDTDQILPARFLKLPRSSELGRVLFHDLRRDAQGNERPDFPLNPPIWRDARALVPRHGDFDWLGQSNSGRCLGINEQFNAARDPGLPPDEAGAFQG